MNVATELATLQKSAASLGADGVKMKRAVGACDAALEALAVRVDAVMQAAAMEQVRTAHNSMGASAIGTSLFLIALGHAGYKLVRYAYRANGHQQSTNTRPCDSQGRKLSSHWDA